MTHITVLHDDDPWGYGKEAGKGRNKRKREEFWCFKAKGHATGAPEVCGGVSALLCALATWLEEEQGPLGPMIRMKPGDVTISFVGRKAAAVAAKVTALGLRQIAEACPEAVSFEDESSRWT